MPIRRSLVNYVRKAHEEGYEYVQIQQELVRAGYPERDINDSMKVAVVNPELLEPAPVFEPAPASFWPRLAAAGIDAAILGVVATMIHTLLAGVMISLGPQAAADLQPLVYIIAMFEILGVWAYSAHLESSHWQGTIGKRVMKLYVTDEYGFKIDFSRASTRSLTKFLSIATLGIGFFISAFGERHMALHDYLAKTRVYAR